MTEFSGFSLCAVCLIFC